MRPVRCGAQRGSEKVAASTSHTDPHETRHLGLLLSAGFFFFASGQHVHFLSEDGPRVRLERFRTGGAFDSYDEGRLDLTFEGRSDPARCFAKYCTARFTAPP